MVAGIITKDAEAKVVEIRQEGKGIDGTDSELDAELVAVEVLCALYCLAIAALQQDEFAAEPNLFRLFAAKTLEELEKLLEEEGTAVFFREICNGAIDLYVRDSPTLRELASSSGVVYFDDMIQITEAEKEQNWMGIFILKAQIRIMDVTPVPHRSIWYVSLAHLFASALLTYGDFFKTLRPVFTLP